MWPSQISRLEDIKDLIKKNTFAPSSNTRVVVKLVDLPTEVFPVQQCQQCKDIFLSSGLLEAVNQVKWGLLDTSGYNVCETKLIKGALCIILYFLECEAHFLSLNFHGKWQRDLYYIREKNSGLPTISCKSALTNNPLSNLEE